jgi:hypothetical protein
MTTDLKQWNLLWMNAVLMMVEGEATSSIYFFFLFPKIKYHLKTQCHVLNIDGGMM